MYQILCYPVIENNGVNNMNHNKTMNEIKKNNIITFLTIIFLLILCLSSCEDIPEENTKSVGGNTLYDNPLLTLEFSKGAADASTYTIAYVCWIENSSKNFIQNVFVCKRVVNGTLTGTALPYWKVNKFPVSDSSEIDAVTKATVKNSDFNIDFNVKDNSVRKFKIYFEVDHSFDSNEWFNDQPALIYSADIDLDSNAKEYTLNCIGWSRGDKLFYGVVSTTLGQLIQVTKYITHKKDASSPQGGNDIFGAAYTDTTPSTNLLSSLKLKVN